jgi:hypothetical protein
LTQLRHRSGDPRAGQLLLVIPIPPPGGTWTGSAVTLSLDAAAGEDRNACAVIVQSGTTGPILGAAFMKLGGNAS